MNKISEFRKNKNISQSTLAELINVSQNTISQWENDVRSPCIKTAIKLARILETTVEELYKQKN